MEEFETFMLSRIQFCKDMLNIISSQVDSIQEKLLEKELETLNNILHHFKQFVKGETDDTYKE